MIKILSTKKYNQFQKDFAIVAKKNMELEADLATVITTSGRDEKLEKAMLRIDDLIIIKHEHKKCQK